MYLYELSKQVKSERYVYSVYLAMSKSLKHLPYFTQTCRNKPRSIIVFKYIIFHVRALTVTVSCSMLYIIQVPEKYIRSTTEITLKFILALYYNSKSQDCRIIIELDSRTLIIVMLYYWRLRNREYRIRILKLCISCIFAIKKIPTLRLFEHWVPNYNTDINKQYTDSCTPKKTMQYHINERQYTH